MVVFLSIFAGLFSLLSLINLGEIGDGNPIGTPLRLLNRDIGALALAVLLLAVYEWRKER